MRVHRGSRTRKCVRMAPIEDGWRRAPTPTNQKVGCSNQPGRIPVNLRIRAPASPSAGNCCNNRRREAAKSSLWTWRVLGETSAPERYCFSGTNPNRPVSSVTVKADQTEKVRAGKTEGLHARGAGARMYRHAPAVGAARPGVPTRRPRQWTVRRRTTTATRSRRSRSPRPRRPARRCRSLRGTLAAGLLSALAQRPGADR